MDFWGLLCTDKLVFQVSNALHSAMVVDFSNIPDDTNERSKMTANAWIEYYRLEEMTRKVVFDPTKAVLMETILHEAARCIWHLHVMGELGGEVMPDNVRDVMANGVMNLPTATIMNAHHLRQVINLVCLLMIYDTQSDKLVAVDEQHKVANVVLKCWDELNK